jgi:hypothetical protein
MDATVINRSTNVGSGIGTSFGGIPFSNTSGGQLSETRFTAQNSRLTLTATSKVGSAALKGYLEADFLGNAAPTLNQVSNANTLRMRLYWVQFTEGKFEFLGGQSWSFMTPNRNGLSPMPGDLFFSQNVDTNYQLGLIWGRTPGFRFIAHASDIVTAGVALENPQQFVGGGVVLPAAFPAGQVDVSGNTSTPNPYPDIIGKVAFDPKTGKLHQHIDAAFLVRGFKTYDPTSTNTFSKTGTGGSINAAIQPVKNLTLIANGFFSDGGGRYIFALGPDFIVNGDNSLTLVKAKSGIFGAEVQAAPKTLVYGYYGLAQFDKQLSMDPSNNKTIGFGVTGSTSANHTMNEETVGVTQTFFRDPKIGGMQLMLQFSHVERTPFSVPANTPSKAKTNVFYVNVRYLLP